jgi:hypothetical protein
MAEERNILVAYWRVICNAARLPMTQADWRILVCMLRHVDVAEYKKTGLLTSWPSIQLLVDETALVPSVIMNSRSRLRSAGVMECITKKRGGAYQPSVYVIRISPLQKLKLTSMLIARQETKARKQRTSGQEPKAQPSKPAIRLVEPPAWPNGPWRGHGR